MCLATFSKTWSALSVALILAAACSTPQQPPPIPEVPTSGFLPAIRDAVNAATADAKAKPGDGAASGRLGMVLHAHDQFAAAEQAYHRAEILDSPHAANWTYYRGVALLASGKATEAAPLLEKSAATLSPALPALLKTADAYLASGDNAKAETYYRKAVAADPNDPSAHFGLGKVTRNPNELEKAVELFPAYGAALFALSQQMQRSPGQATRARELLTRYEKFKTTAPPLADPLLDAVAELNAGPTTLVRKAQAAAAQGDLQTSIRLHREALSLDPKMVQAQVNLISLYARSNMPEQAAQAYRDAIALNPNLAEAHYNYGVLLYSTPGGLPEAKAMFEKAIAADPSHASAHHNLGAILQQQGQLVAAQKEFERAVAIDPSARNSRFQLGRLYANAGRNADAIAQFEKTVEIDDEMTPTYLYALAAVQARAGNAKPARELLFQAREKAQARSQTQLVESIDRDLSRMAGK